jgi:hypothetical protein
MRADRRKIKGLQFAAQSLGNAQLTAGIRASGGGDEGFST